MWLFLPCAHVYEACCNCDAFNFFGWGSSVTAIVFIFCFLLNSMFKLERLFAGEVISLEEYLIHNFILFTLFVGI